MLRLLLSDVGEDMAEILCRFAGLDGPVVVDMLRLGTSECRSLALRLSEWSEAFVVGFCTIRAIP